ncbi:glycosyltransferase [Kamptonema cortianum]|nr:glycosyltransferase [Oscillatoria laete-virens]MDK3160214.1 glycosyltransferase [Kamptonema cortianum]MDL5048433.1 glycosyltransferase [Oscillatoria amoena NRMC-F 0135]MDL5055656.1 glycosyltransferase [Oscillatoria laete-virens NRMC-F 0139]
MPDIALNPTVSCVIPAFNEEKYIHRVVQGIQRAGEYYRKEKNLGIEIIVVDNHSKDRTGEIAQELGAKVVHEPSNNIARASNIGALTAVGDFLMFIDADMIPSEDLISGIDDNLMNPEVAGGGTRCRMEKWSPGFAFYRKVQESHRQLFGGFHGVFHCRRKDFVELLGFDERNFIAEKVEFYHRLKAHGKLRGQKIADAPRGCVIESDRIVTQSGAMKLIGKTLSLCWAPNKKIRDINFCGPWYDVRRV